LLGTPHYMAPELWRAEPASRRSDVYALGVLLYILCSGRPPTEAASPVELATRVQEQEPRPLLERAPRVDPRLASIIDRCLRRDPFARFSSADDLRSALEQLTPMGRELAIPEGNPYRGLQAFEAQHRALFFGRSAEIRAVVERLRGDAIVVVAGDSGAGKSSLCPRRRAAGGRGGRARAGPLVGQRRHDARPLSAADPHATLAGLFDMTEETVSALIAGVPDALIRALRKQLGDVRGRLIFVDQLEELVTLGDAARGRDRRRGAGAPRLGHPRAAARHHGARRLPDPRGPDPGARRRDRAGDLPPAPADAGGRPRGDRRPGADQVGELRDRGAGRRPGEGRLAWQPAAAAVRARRAVGDPRQGHGGDHRRGPQPRSAA
jgi:hypothetical protein